MKKIRWGIIGCGDVTEVKSGPAFYKTEGSELVAVMRRNAALAEDYAKRHKVPQWFSDADELINCPDVDAVYVATPPDTHALYAKKAIEAGKPVYVEKPMCRTYPECLDVNKLAEEKGVPLFVAYYRRNLEGFAFIKQQLEAKAIGEIRIVNIQLFKHFEYEPGEKLPWRVLPEVAGGGHFYDLASHQIDLLDFYFGPVKKIASVANNLSGHYYAEDHLSASLEYENGVIVNASWSFNSSPVNDCDKFIIYGTKGRIEFSTFDFVPVKIIHESGTEEFGFPKPEHVQQKLIEAMVKNLQGEKIRVSNGQNGARVNYILEEIVKEYNKNQ